MRLSMLGLTDEPVDVIMMSFEDCKGIRTIIILLL